MNNYNFEGTIEKVLPVEEFTNFKKQAVVVTAEEKKDDKSFTHKHYFEFLGDKTSLLEGLTVGQAVNVSFNIKTSEYEKEGNTKYFPSLTAWKIEKK